MLRIFVSTTIIPEQLGDCGQCSVAPVLRDIFVMLDLRSNLANGRRCAMI